MGPSNEEEDEEEDMICSICYKKSYYVTHVTENHKLIFQPKRTKLFLLLFSTSQPQQNTKHSHTKMKPSLLLLVLVVALTLCQ